MTSFFASSPHQHFLRTPGFPGDAFPTIMHSLPRPSSTLLYSGNGRNLGPRKPFSALTNEIQEIRNESQPPQGYATRDMIQLQPKSRPTCTLSLAHVHVETYSPSLIETKLGTATLADAAMSPPQPSTSTTIDNQDANASALKSASQKFGSTSTINTIPFPAPSPILSPISPLSPLSALSSSFTIITGHASTLPVDQNFNIGPPQSAFFPCAPLFSTPHTLFRNTAAIVGRAISRITKTKPTNGSAMDGEWQKIQKAGYPVAENGHTFIRDVPPIPSLPASPSASSPSSTRSQPVTIPKKRTRESLSGSSSSGRRSTGSSSTSKSDDKAKKAKTKHRNKKRKGTTVVSPDACSVDFPSLDGVLSQESTIHIPAVSTPTIHTPKPSVAVGPFVVQDDAPDSITVDPAPSPEPEPMITISAGSTTLTIPPIPKTKPPLPPLHIPQRSTPSTAAPNPLPSGPRVPRITVPPSQTRRPRIPSADVNLLIDLYRSLMLGLEVRRQLQEEQELAAPPVPAIKPKEAPDMVMRDVSLLEQVKEDDLEVQDALLALRLKSFLKHSCRVRDSLLDVDVGYDDDYDSDDDMMLDGDELEDEDELDEDLDLAFNEEGLEEMEVEDEDSTPRGLVGTAERQPRAVAKTTSPVNVSPVKTSVPPTATASPLKGSSPTSPRAAEQRQRSRTPSPTSPVASGINFDTHHIVARLMLRKRNRSGRRSDGTWLRGGISALRNEVRGQEPTNGLAAF